MKNLWQEIKNIEVSARTVRSFGRTIGSVLLFIGLGMWHFERSHDDVFLVLGFFLLLSGVFIPRILAPIYHAWMALGLVLGGLVSRIILLLLFYVAVTPIAFLARIAGKKFIDKKFEKNTKTYWLKRATFSDSVSLEKQF